VQPYAVLSATATAVVAAIDARKNHLKQRRSDLFKLPKTDALEEATRRCFKLPKRRA
jgi:hypothetical protein